MESDGDDLFAEVVFIIGCTTARALEDGVPVDVTETTAAGCECQDGKLTRTPDEQSADGQIADEELAARSLLHTF